MAPDQSGGSVEFGHAEGWYTDPYGRHEGRWMSMGKPTALVRDGNLESDDPPPTSPPTKIPTRIPAEGEGPQDGHDLKRADDAEREMIDPEKLRQELLDAAEEGIDGAARD